jgi:hypothetical protein
MPAIAPVYFNSALLHVVTAKAEHFERLYSNDRHLLAACASVRLEGVNPIAPSE